MKKQKFITSAAQFLRLTALHLERRQDKKMARVTAYAFFRAYFGMVQCYGNGYGFNNDNEKIVALCFCADVLENRK